MTRRVKKITDFQIVPPELMSDEDYTLLVDKETGTTKVTTLQQLVSFVTGSGFGEIEGGTGSFDILTASFLGGDGSDITNLRIGEPEDGTFEDGLFIDFNNRTTVGTAIDRLNEVLKGLAPQPAPELLNIQSSLSGIPMKLSFDSSSPITNYFNVTASLSEQQINIGINEIFAPSLQKRLGCFSSPVNISVVLNDTTQADQLVAINYPNDAFNVDRYGTGSYILEVNGVSQAADEILGTGSLQGTYFNLTDANIAKFIGTGLPFDLFRHRTGVVTVPLSLWREGHNYAKVISSSSLGEKITNYVDWVYDPVASNGNEDYVITSQVSGAIASGFKELSGIKYYTSFEYYFDATINNYYKNIYSAASNGGISMQGINLPNGLSVPLQTIEQFSEPPAPSTNADVLSRKSRHATGAIRSLGQSFASQITINNGLGKTGASQLQTGTILMDNVNTANDGQNESFCREDFRLVSSSIGNIGSAAPFDSSTDISTTNDLLVYGGSLRYPTKSLNNGNISAAQVDYILSNQPNYSNVDNVRYYFRKFQNIGLSRGNMKVTIKGTQTNIVRPSVTLEQDNIKISVARAGITSVWRNIAVPFAQTELGSIGNAKGTIPTALNTNGVVFDLTWAPDSPGLLPNEVWFMMIEASKEWQGNITKIEIEYY